jgi:hypothetical protein
VDDVGEGSGGDSPVFVAVGKVTQHPDRVVIESLRAEVRLHDIHDGYSAARPLRHPRGEGTPPWQGYRATRLAAREQHARQRANT